MAVRDLEAMDYVTPGRPMAGYSYMGDDFDIPDTLPLDTGSIDTTSLETMPSPIDLSLFEPSQLALTPTDYYTATGEGASIIDPSTGQMLTALQAAQLAASLAQTGANIAHSVSSPVPLAQVSPTGAPAVSSGVGQEISGFLSAQSIIPGQNNGTVLMLSAAAITLVGVLASRPKSRRR